MAPLMRSLGHNPTEAEIQDAVHEVREQRRGSGGAYNVTVLGGCGWEWGGGMGGVLCVYVQVRQPYIKIKHTK